MTKQGTIQDRGALRTTRSVRRSLIRPAVDAVAALAVFVLVAASLASDPLWAKPGPAAFAGVERPLDPVVAKALGDSQPAPIVEIATASAANGPDAVYRKTSAQAAWVLLALAFSAVAAFNLAILRHLRTAYVPRKRAGKAEPGAHV